MMKSHRVMLVSTILLAAVLACNTLTPTTAPPEAAPTEPPVVDEPITAPDSEIVIPAVNRLQPFASYTITSSQYPDSFDGYTLPLDLDMVAGLDVLDLSPAQINLLEQNGFVVTAPVAGEFNEFYHVYEAYRYELTPAFITTDSVLHVYHLLFDKLLRDLETKFFIPTLETLTITMLDKTATQLSALENTALAEPVRRNLAFFGVAAVLLELDTDLPAEVQSLVDAEVALINAHGSQAISPIWDRADLLEKLIEDYTQYVPRGHYTRSPELEKYFRTMMWYGRLTFRTRDRFETQRALLLTEALRTANAADGTPAETLWRNIYEPTVFLVGKADDLSFFEYGELSDAIFGSNPDPVIFADEALLDAFLLATEELPPPQVNSMWVWIWEDVDEATKGFRFMGQRFTIDAYVFGQMIWRKVGTMAEPRGLPRALDFFAAQGSEEALSLLENMGENEYENFDTQMTKVRSELAALEQDSWTQNVYWAWLYSLQPVFAEKDQRFPAFMQTQAWERKDLHTALGSYTELKHDTILYAKQVMAELGGGPGDLPHGYVEPNPEAFARLHALASMTYQGLQTRDLLDERMAGNLLNLQDLLAFLQTTAEKELNGEALSEEDYFRIRFFGGEIEALTYAAADCDAEDTMMGTCRDLQDQKAALVADVATGFNEDGELVVLEEAIGQPTRIFVVLPDEPLRIAVGAVFSYYEFINPTDERLTDEEWQAMVAAGTQPPQPEWTQMFIAP